MTLKKKLAVGGAGGVLAMSVTMLANFEGERVSAYYDPVGVPTICYGKTEDVDINDRASHEECVRELKDKANKVLANVYKAVGKVPDATAAALVSFCYNVGQKNCERSETFRLIRENDPQRACDSLMNWQRAGNNVHLLRGRREEERDMCLKGFRDEGMLEDE